MSHRLFPLFVDLSARRVLLVGAGHVALRKLAALRDTGAEIVIGAREFCADIEASPLLGGFAWGVFNPSTIHAHQFSAAPLSS